jgi:hypothetical protein
MNMLRQIAPRPVSHQKNDKRQFGSVTSGDLLPSPCQQKVPSNVHYCSRDGVYNQKHMETIHRETMYLQQLQQRRARDDARKIDKETAEEKIMNEWHIDWVVSERENGSQGWNPMAGNGLLLQPSRMDSYAHAMLAKNVPLNYYGGKDERPEGTRLQATRWEIEKELHDRRVATQWGRGSQQAPIFFGSPMEDVQHIYGNSNHPVASSALNASPMKKFRYMQFPAEARHPQYLQLSDPRPPQPRHKYFKSGGYDYGYNQFQNGSLHY